MFRRIEATDKDRLKAGFEKLSPESRYRRFFSYLDHLSEAQLRFLTEVDFENHFAWIAVLENEPGQPGIGVARWVRLADEPRVAEAAVTVVDSYHGRGIGKTLLFLLARSAAEHGVGTLRGWVLADNEPIVETLEGLGARPGRIDGGVREVNVPLPDDVAELDATPAPLILRAVAAGAIEVRAVPERPGSVRFS